MDTKKMRACAPLLPPPGDEVVCECLDEIERLEAEVARMKSKTYCAYCGKEYAIDTDASLVAEHIATCEKHPMRKVEEQLVAERAKTAAWKAWLEELRLHSEGVITSALGEKPVDAKAWQVVGYYNPWPSLEEEKAEATADSDD